MGASGTTGQNERVDMTARLEAPCPPEELFEQVEDLSTYPEWLTIVPRVEPAAPERGDHGPVWMVELRGRIGPLARSKRLRMVRTVHEPVRHARFERRELDGRDHSPWVLDAVVEGSGHESTLEMSLHYGGSFGGGLVEKLLADEIAASRPRLVARVTAGRLGDS
jgi:hypothetical protein